MQPFETASPNVIGYILLRGIYGRNAMMHARQRSLSRRGVIKDAAALAAASMVPTRWAIAQAKPLKVGLMLPYSGTFAKLGENITFAIEVLLAEKGGKLAGREIQIIKLDDESK